MMKNEVEKSKSNGKKYFFLMLLLLLVAIGIWKCPNQSESKTISETPPENDSLQIVESVHNETNLLEKTPSSIKEESSPEKKGNDLSNEAPQDEGTASSTFPPEKIEAAMIDKEEKAIVSETKIPNQTIIVQQVKKK